MICRFCEAQIVNVSGLGEYSKYENRMICRARNEECDVPHCSWLNCDHFYAARRVNSMFYRGDDSMGSFCAQKDYDAIEDDDEMEHER